MNVKRVNRKQNRFRVVLVLATILLLAVGLTSCDYVAQFPDASDTGPRYAPLFTDSDGLTLESVSDLPAQTTGSGTAADPYVINRMKIDNGLTVGGWDPSNLSNKYVVFRDCIIHQPGYLISGQGEDERLVHLRYHGPKVIFDHCLIGPTMAGATYAATDGAFIQTIRADRSFELLYSEVYGGSSNISLSTEAGDFAAHGYTVIERNWLHGTYSHYDPVEDEYEHTNSINGNMHASHVKVNANTIDGATIDGSSAGDATHGLGIYNDPSGVYVITDWQITGNLFLNHDTHIFSSTSTSYLQDPWIIKHNCLTDTFSYQRVLTRTPSEGQGQNFDCPNDGDPENAGNVVF